MLVTSFDRNLDVRWPGAYAVRRESQENKFNMRTPARGYPSYVRIKAGTNASSR